MRNIIQYKLLTVMAIFILVLPACKKEFLDKLPPTSLTPELALATEADLQTALMGTYSGLRAVDFFWQKCSGFCET
jgi:hypothetical protein